MNIKRLSTTIATVGILTLSTFAAARGPMDRLADKLDLTESQTTRISTLFEAHRDLMRAQFGDRVRDSGPAPEAREHIKSARDALHQKILSVLDAEQAAQFKQIVAERQGRRGGPERRGKPIKTALEQLDLSELQQNAIASLMAEQEVERSEDRDRFRSELASILTDDQLAQLEEVSEKRRGR